MVKTSCGLRVRAQSEILRTRLLHDTVPLRLLRVALRPLPVASSVTAGNVAATRGSLWFSGKRGQLTPSLL